MKAFRSMLAIVAVVALMVLSALSATAAEPGVPPSVEVLRDWYKLALALVRHTPTYSPPVAARTFAYLGATAFEATASGDDKLLSLAGQLNGLKPTPQRVAGETYDEATVLDAALSAAVGNLFGNTGPTGQRAMAALEDKLHAQVSAALPADVAARSETYGRAVAEHILAWSRDDGGAVVENMGFPLEYTLTKGPAHWAPTSLIAQQQVPLLPDWGKNRTLVMPNGATCPLPPPLEYSEDKSSEFYKQALEVYQTRQTLTQEQRDIARFWSDDAMLTVTPPGHWISIALKILAHENAELDEKRRRAGASGARHVRRFRRLLEHEVRVRSGAADDLYPPHHRSEVGAVADHAAVSRISERPQHADGRGRGRDDAIVRREFRL